MKSDYEQEAVPRSDIHTSQDIIKTKGSNVQFRKTKSIKKDTSIKKYK